MLVEVHRPAPTTLDHVLIVPRAHSAIVATRFQIEIYDLFHRTLGGRLGHMIGTPITVFGVFLALRGSTQALWPGMLLLAAIVAFGMRIDKFAASLTGLLGAALLGLAALWPEAVMGSATLVGAVQIGAGCAIQTLSHLFEDVPPPLSGTRRFVCFWLELWATPRIWAIQMLQLLMALGYEPELRAALDRRAQEILAHPTGDGRRPQ